MNQIVWVTTFVVTTIVTVFLGFIRFQRLPRDKKSDVQLQTGRTDNQELTTLATSLVVLGIVFGTNRLIGYSFIGAGVLLSIISIIKYRLST